MSAPRGPGFTRWILRTLLRGPDAEFVLGDIEEEYERVVAEQGADAARRWYRAQALGTVSSWLTRRRVASLGTWSRESRLALRGLLRSPGYTLTTVFTLSLGIGGVATVGTLAYSVLRPLPYPDSGRLVAVWETKEGRQRWVAPANYLDWRRGAGSFAGLAAHDIRGASVTIGGVATRELVAVVSGNFFDVLGVQPLLGRAFDPELDSSFGDRLAVLSHAAWTDAFGADPSAIGRSFQVEDVTYEVIGVMPAGVDQPGAGLFGWLRSPTEAPGIPGFGGDLTAVRDAWYFEVLGRLAPGASLETARAEMAAVAARLEELHPDTNRSGGALVVPLLEQTVAGTQSMLLALGAAVSLLLLAAAVNVVHLTLARGAGRAVDSAVKVSLGAAPADLRRQLIVEAWMLGAAGAAVGLLWAELALSVGRGVVASLPRSTELGLDPGVSALTLLGSVALGTIVALAAHRRRTDGSRAMGTIRSGSARAVWMSRGLVAVQVAAAIAILAATGLMARTVYAIADVDLGFDPDGLTTFRLALPDAATRDYPERIAAYEEVRDRLAALPGVAAVSFGSESPLAVGPQAGVQHVGAEPVDEPPGAGWQPVEPGLFDALGMEIVNGRALTTDDRPGSTDVAVVNEAFVRDVLLGADPLGALVTMGLEGHDRPLRIVGVVADTRTRGPTAPPAAVLYRPVAQTDRYGASSVLMAVRARGPTGPDEATLRRAAREVAPGLPLYGEATGADLARPFRGSQTTLLVILATFAGTALLLGLVGVYGVAAYAVRQQRREIGVRMALGADRRRVMTHVVGRGMGPALVGLPVGIALALVLGRFLEGLLFGVPAADPVTLAAVSALVLTALAASLYIPGRAAAATDPARATREA